MTSLVENRNGSYVQHFWYAIMLLSGSSWCRLYDALNSLDQWRLRVNAYEKIVGTFCLYNYCFSWSKYSIPGHMKLIICGKMFSMQSQFWNFYLTTKIGRSPMPKRNTKLEGNSCTLKYTQEFLECLIDKRRVFAWEPMEAHAFRTL